MTLCRTPQAILVEALGQRLSPSERAAGGYASDTTSESTYGEDEFKVKSNGSSDMLGVQDWVLVGADEPVAVAV